MRNDAAFYNAWKYVFLVVIFSGVLAFGICFLLRNYGVGRENREFQTMSEEDGGEYFFVLSRAVMEGRYPCSSDFYARNWKINFVIENRFYESILFWSKISYVQLSEICDKKVIGYFSESHTSEITINHISKLTHAVFAFVIMKSDGTVMFRDKLAQERFLKIRDIANQASPKLKMLISIGGPANSDNFLPVISSPDRKKLRCFIG